MIIGYDTETTGLNPYLNDKMFAWSTCTLRGDVDVKRLDKNRQYNIKHLRKIFDNTELAKVCHNVKFDFKMTENKLDKKYIEESIIHDTYIQSHIVDSGIEKRGLKFLCYVLSGYKMDDEEAVKRIVREGGDYSNVPEDLMNEYQHHDARRVMLLHRFFYPKIKNNKDWLDCYNIEIQLIKDTLRMEDRGLYLDVEKAKSVRDELLSDSEKVLKEIQQAAGYNLNPKSPDQLQWFLFKKLGLPVLAITEKDKKPKTDKHVFFELHKKFPDVELLNKILQYRSWTSGAASMVNYLSFADSNNTLHPSINTCGARTGRQSCKMPNLQNVRKFGGLLDPYPVNERQIFIPRPGYLNIHIDYSGIELRLLIHFSKDKILVDAIKDKLDIHNFVAGKVLGSRFTKLKEGTKQFKILRDACKNNNFAIPYGSGPAKVAKIFNYDLREGSKIYNAYKHFFPNLVGLNNKYSKLAREDGFVTSPFGRRYSNNKVTAYTALNTLIQGTGGDILKRAQVRIAKYLREKTSNEVKMLLSIHDEIILEYPKNRMREYKGFLLDVRKLAIDFDMFNVPLEIGIQIVTKDWSKKRGIKL